MRWPCHYHKASTCDHVDQQSGDRKVYEVAAKALREFGSDSCILDGCGSQTDTQLWEGVYKSDGGPPVSWKIVIGEAKSPSNPMLRGPALRLSWQYFVQIFFLGWFKNSGVADQSTALTTLTIQKLELTFEDVPCVGGLCETLGTKRLGEAAKR